jgi:DNA-directed DNA polymerase III PolC
MIVEWCATSYFSFLEGATSPLELMEEASRLGYRGLALGDRMGLCGLVEAMRANEGLSDKNFFYAPGIRLHFDHADPLFVYPLHKAAHGKLCRFLSEWALDGMAEREKGLAPIPWFRFRDFLKSQKDTIRESYLLFSISGRFYPWPEKESEAFKRTSTLDVDRVAPSFSVPPTQEGQCPFWLIELADLCGRGEESALSLVWPLTLAPGIEDLQRWLLVHSRQLRIPLVASTLPLFAHEKHFERARVVGAIRHRKPLDSIGLLDQVNSQRKFLPRGGLLVHRDIWKEVSSASDIDPFERSVALTRRHAFSLRELNYRYPSERVPEGENPSAYFERLVREGAQRRYPEGIPLDIEKQIRHELALIRDLGFEDYFLTIHDVLDYARSKKILFQGRGSAANSVVCYCLGITSIDPVRMQLLFERFLSRERAEAPDIDIDFEHERREEVLQEIYARYGRHRAAMVANTIRFRGRMAVREAARALGYTDEELETLAVFMGREGFGQLREHFDELPKGALSPRALRRLPDLIRIADSLKGLPRHLGIHSCGFVLSSEDLREQCILEPARKQMRSVVPWNKDDIDTLNWVKVDFLSLGMLTAVRKCFDLIGNRNVTGHRLELATVPKECPTVYRAARRGDTVGVFQIESRAQMNMLPRLAPKNFYDLVIQIAIVRPGPIQGGMVHPYLKRRQGWEKWTYDHPKLEPILKKTLGVPIFQEQIMRMAVAVGGFSAGEADQMRKVMSGAWRSKSQMHKHREKLFAGMKANGLPPDYCERIYKQMEGFGDYGFPESHSASFAIIAYVSAWLKEHHPAEFLCALLNSQPLGFYSPRALVEDARRHGVRVLPSDARHSRWESTLEQGGVRLGFHLQRGFEEEQARQLEALQDSGFFERNPDFSPLDLRSRLPQATLEKLVKAGACRPREKLAHDERPAQMWQIIKTRHEDPLRPKLFEEHAPSPALLDESWNEWSSIVADYRVSGLSLREHPVQYARRNFFPMMADWKTAEDLWRIRGGTRVSLIGLLAVKQKPPTAGGMCFLTLEDESGFFNIVVKPDVYRKFRTLMDQAPVLAVRGLVTRSPRRDPRDPHSCALSVGAEDMWNPFSRSEHAPRENIAARRTSAIPIDNV